ncbi:hypothetical protein TYRP_020530, partial [Tyrophagus putrescentiae]
RGKEFDKKSAQEIEKEFLADPADGEGIGPVYPLKAFHLLHWQYCTMQRRGRPPGKGRGRAADIEKALQDRHNELQRGYRAQRTPEQRAAQNAQDRERQAANRADPVIGPHLNRQARRRARMPENIERRNQQREALPEGARERIRARDREWHQNRAGIKTKAEYTAADKQGRSNRCSCCGRLFVISSLVSCTAEQLRDQYQIDGSLIDRLRRACPPEHRPASNMFQLCSVCKKNLLANVFPDFCYDTCPLPEIPAEIARLNATSVRLIAPELPFTQITPLTGTPQTGVSSVIYVPAVTSNTVRRLPREDNDAEVIQVPGSIITSNASQHQQQVRYEQIDRTAVAAALRVLRNRPVYEGIEINEQYAQGRRIESFVVAPRAAPPPPPPPPPPPLAATNQPQQQLHQHQHYNPVSGETLVWNQNDTDQALCEFREYADKELDRLEPHSMPFENPLVNQFNETAEFRRFINVYLGSELQVFAASGERDQDGNRVFNNSVSYYRRSKWELEHGDTRFQSAEHIFFKYVALMQKRMEGALDVYLRQIPARQAGNNNNQPLTAADVRTSRQLGKLLRANKCYELLRGIHNSPTYWAGRKREVHAMIRQLGPPTLFLTLSQAQTEWPQLLITLAKVLDNRVLSEEEAKELPRQEKLDLLRRHPVTVAHYFNRKVELLFNFMQHCADEESPFGRGASLVDHYIRVEFGSETGAPHVHCLLWLNGDSVPKPASENNQQISNFVDQCISCSRGSTEAERVLVAKHQVHHHSGSCQKAGECRFGYPLPPMPCTVLLTPLSDAERNAPQVRDQALLIRNELIRRSTDENQDGLTFAEMLREPAFGGCTEQQYIDAVRYWLKSPKFGASALQLRPYINEISKRFLYSRQLGVQEPLYTLLGLPVSKCSRSVEFINTNPPETRDRKLKPRAELNALPPESEEIFARSNLIYYTLRNDDLKDLSAEEVVANYRVHLGRPAGNAEERMEEGGGSGPSDEEMETSSGDTVHLNDPDLRDPFNYMREQLMLYIPWRDEEENILRYCDTMENLTTLYNYRLEEITARKLELFPSSNFEKTFEHKVVNRRAQWTGLVGQKIQLGDAFAILYPRNDPRQPLQQGNAGRDRAEEGERVRGEGEDEEDGEDGEDGEDDEDENAELRPDFQRPPLLPVDEYVRQLARLNDQQRQIVLEVLRLYSSNKQFYIFVYGGAGTGKSFFIKMVRFVIADYARRRAELAGGPAVAAPPDPVLLLAPTVLANLRAEHRGVNLALVDESSMVSSSLLGQVSTRFNQIAGLGDDALFGGKSVILVGDFGQLRPVNGAERHQGDSAFANALNELRLGSNQLSPQAKGLFANCQWPTAEERVRRPSLPPDTLHLFRSNREVDRFNSEAIKRARASNVYAESHAVDRCQGVNYLSVDRLNEELEQVVNRHYTANCGLSRSLELCTNLRYMLTSNLATNDGLVNGAIGRLMRFERMPLPTEEEQQQQQQRRSQQQNQVQELGRVYLLWLLFDRAEVGQRARSQYSEYIGNQQGEIDNTWTPQADDRFRVTAHHIGNFNLFATSTFADQAFRDAHLLLLTGTGQLNDDGDRIDFGNGFVELPDSRIDPGGGLGGSVVVVKRELAHQIETVRVHHDQQGRGRLELTMLKLETNVYVISVFKSALYPTAAFVTALRQLLESLEYLTAVNCLLVVGSIALAPEENTQELLELFQRFRLTSLLPRCTDEVEEGAAGQKQLDFAFGRTGADISAHLYISPTSLHPPIMAYLI